MSTVTTCDMCGVNLHKDKITYYTVDIKSTSNYSSSHNYFDLCARCRGALLEYVKYYGRAEGT